MTPRKSWMLLTVLGWAAGLPVRAAEERVVVPAFGEAAIPKHVELQSVLAPPSHGVLEDVGEPNLAYVPADAFWSLGLDSLVYRGADGRAATLVLTPGENGSDRHTGFEPLEPEGEAWNIHDPEEARLSVESPAALDGELGLRVLPGAAPAWVEPQPLDAGAGQQGTGSGMKIRLPNGGGGNLVAGSLTFHAIKRGAANAVSLRARWSGGNTYGLRLGACGQEANEITLPAGTHRLAITWRESDSRWAEARLRVNDMVVARASGFCTLEGALHHTFGALDDSAGRWALDLDDLTVDTGGVSPGSQVVLASDFELGSPWHATGLGAPGAVEFGPQGALNGKRGARLKLAARGYRHSDAPEAEAAVGVRLGLLVGEDVDLPEEGATVLGGSTSDSAHDVIDVFALRLATREGRAYVEAVTWDDEGTPLTRRVAVPRGQPHLVELQWRAAGPAHDGLLRLWMDGAVAGEITQIHGAPIRLESLSFGVMGSEGGQGEVSVDDILVWRPARHESTADAVSLQ